MKISRYFFLKKNDVQSFSLYGEAFYQRQIMKICLFVILGVYRL